MDKGVLYKIPPPLWIQKRWGWRVFTSLAREQNDVMHFYNQWKVPIQMPKDQWEYTFGFFGFTSSILRGYILPFWHKLRKK